MKKTDLTKAEKVFLDAMISVAETHPTSVLGDLLMLFPPEVAVKLVETFAGDTISFPKLNTIWKTYRSKVIRNTLSAKNDSLTRQKLAAYFGISTNKVSEIYHGEKEKVKQVSDSLLAKSARRLYRHDLDQLLKDVKIALSSK